MTFHQLFVNRHPHALHELLLAKIYRKGTKYLLWSPHDDPGQSKGVKKKSITFEGKSLDRELRPLKRKVGAGIFRTMFQSVIYK